MEWWKRKRGFSWVLHRNYHHFINNASCHVFHQRSTSVVLIPSIWVELILIWRLLLNFQTRQYSKPRPLSPWCTRHLLWLIEMCQQSVDQPTTHQIQTMWIVFKMIVLEEAIFLSTLALAKYENGQAKFYLTWGSLSDYKWHVLIYTMRRSTAWSN